MNSTLLMMAICMFLLEAMSPVAGSAEQICKESIIATSPDSSFILHDDGTATQKTTGIMWMRCALGQQWNGSACKGSAASAPWAETLKASVLQKFAGYSDWRLPNKNELESIVEEQCVSPSINAKVFPGTPPMFFWSSSPYVGLGTAAWSVDFGFGAITPTEKSGKIAARLMREPE